MAADLPWERMLQSNFDSVEIMRELQANLAEGHAIRRKLKAYIS